MTGAGRHAGFAAAVLALALAGAAAAQEQPRRAVSGRTAPAEREEARPAGEPGWCFGVVAGMLAGGDLFQVAHGIPVPWSPPVGGEDFNAKRFTVTLDEDAAFGFEAAKRLTPQGWLRFDLLIGRMNTAALANDTQYVTPVLYDRWNVFQSTLLWEQRLTDTRLQPLILAGVSITGINASAASSDQSVPGLCLGAGFLYRVDDRWSAGLDVVDHFQQFTQDGLAQEQDFPLDAQYREFGPQHLVTITLRLLGHF
ncbi:MAG: hypothetical protein Q7W56_11455 [Candidatus Latescibacteria bacterium]|nr:hypothetical protein [Candidatus Latescibacterota bacterium]